MNLPANDPGGFIFFRPLRPFAYRDHKRLLQYSQGSKWTRNTQNPAKPNGG
jgi:hypothetical protein